MPPSSARTHAAQAVVVAAVAVLVFLLIKRACRCRENLEDPKKPKDKKKETIKPTADTKQWQFKPKPKTKTFNPNVIPENHKNVIRKACAAGYTWAYITRQPKWSYLSKYNGDVASRICQGKAKSLTDKLGKKVAKGGLAEDDKRCKHGRCPVPKMGILRPCLNKPKDGEKRGDKCCNYELKDCQFHGNARISGFYRPNPAPGKSKVAENAAKVPGSEEKEKVEVDPFPGFKNDTIPGRSGNKGTPHQGCMFYNKSMTDDGKLQCANGYKDTGRQDFQCTMNDGCLNKVKENQQQTKRVCTPNPRVGQVCGG